MVQRERTIEKVSGAIQHSNEIRGLTHNIDGYPAKFPPSFPRVILEDFTEPEDYVFDPFCGSGTVLVEAAAMGRKVLGVDINPVACLLSRVKSTSVPSHTLRSVRELAPWPDKDGIHFDTISDPWVTGGFARNLPSKLTAFIQASLRDVRKQDNIYLRRILRVCLLETCRRALETRKTVPGLTGLVELRAEILQLIINSMEKFTQTSERPLQTDLSKVILGDVEDVLLEARTTDNIRRPDILITSPPYPGVHVLYHRWQIDGARETPALMWIANYWNTEGGKYFTMGGRSSIGQDEYFERLQSIYFQAAQFSRPNALLFQLVGFSNVDAQFERFNSALQRSGWREVSLTGADQEPISRTVPNRKWYNNLSGQADQKTEFLFVHQNRKEGSS